MSFLWISAAISSKVEQLRDVEAQLLEHATKFVSHDVYGERSAPSSSCSGIEFFPFDTPIPRAVVPLKKHGDDLHKKGKGSDGEYIIHGIKVTNSNHSASSQPETAKEPPLVLLHGYMNGCAYFYRNFAGLSKHFSSGVYALDLLGWGLSSRPQFKLKDDKVETAEDFFVESLEAWRKVQNIDRMVLAGHSMGGYLSVAYTERYPEHVEQVVLLSPVGVNYEDERSSGRREAMRQSSWSMRLKFGIYAQLFERKVLGCFARTAPSGWIQDKIAWYVDMRLPSISDKREKQSLRDYLYLNVALPGSGEECLPSFLNPFAFAKKPLIDRIPKLDVKKVSFLYGDSDWMDSSGGQAVEAKCEALRRSSEHCGPIVDVHEIQKAGHLLILDNWEGANAGILHSLGKKEVGLRTDYLRRL